MKDENYYRIKDLSERFSVPYMTMYRLVRNGIIKSVRFGKIYRVSEQAIQDYLEQQTKAVGA